MTQQVNRTNLIDKSEVPSVLNVTRQFNENTLRFIEDVLAVPKGKALVIDLNNRYLLNVRSLRAKFDLLKRRGKIPYYYTATMRNTTSKLEITLYIINGDVS